MDRRSGAVRFGLHFRVILDALNEGMDFPQVVLSGLCVWSAGSLAAAGGQTDRQGCQAQRN
jgi:hypothetical protein